MNTFSVPTPSGLTFVLIGVLSLLVAIGLASIIGVLTSKLARAKGYNGYFWTGFFLQLIGLLYVIGLPMAQDRYQRRR